MTDLFNEFCAPKTEIRTVEQVLGVLNTAEFAGLVKKCGHYSVHPGTGIQVMMTT